jgi:hypothetical protein
MSVLVAAVGVGEIEGEEVMPSKDEATSRSFLQPGDDLRWLGYYKDM